MLESFEAEARVCRKLEVRACRANAILVGVWRTTGDEVAGRRGKLEMEVWSLNDRLVIASGRREDLHPKIHRQVPNEG